MFRLNANQWIAIATVVNVAIVGVLAIINFRYMRSASKQADAADRQAKAAFENIALVKDQIQSQAKLKVTETLIDLRRMVFLVEMWCPKVRDSWGDLPPYEPFLSDNWPSMVHVIEKITPNQAENLRKIEQHILNAETLIKGQLARNPTNRQANVMQAAANDLDEISATLKAVLLEAENVSRRAYP
jgi:hypothetical protein